MSLLLAATPYYLKALATHCGVGLRSMAESNKRHKQYIQFCVEPVNSGINCTSLNSNGAQV